MNKKLRNTILGLATIIGTYTGGHGDLPPIYSHKTENSYGINMAIYTKIDSGVSINGANLSLVTENHGTINGVSASFVNMTNGRINGADIALGTSYIGNNAIVNGLEAALFNGMLIDTMSARVVNGVQLSLVSSTCQELNGLQVGLLLEEKSYDKGGVLLNLDCHNTK